MGIYDRDYARSGGGFEVSADSSAMKFLYLIIGVCIAVFLLNEAGLLWQEDALGSRVRAGAVSWDALRSGKIWTLFTYAFVHGSILHLVFNMIVLWFAGKVVAPILGVRIFAMMYFGAIIAAVAVEFLHNLLLGQIVGMFVPGAQIYQAQLIGASGGVIATVMAFCAIVPNQRMNVLLFFIIPLSVTGKNLARGLIIASLALALIADFRILFGGRGIAMVTDTAHFAHIGGGLFGYFFVFWLKKRVAIGFDTPVQKSGKRSLTKSFKGVFQNKKSSQNVESPVDIKSEVDKILDKINDKGFASLNSAERKVLEEFSKKNSAK